MKGLALAIVIGLACIRSNTDGMRVSVNVGINSSDEPGKHESKIVGGEPVEPHSIPWQVKLPTCGGTIICPRFVMTAAHCSRREVVYVGVHNKIHDMTEDKKHVVKKIHQHPQYEKVDGWNYYDYLLLELQDPIRLGLDAMAIFLPDGKEKFNQESLFLTSGWGRTSQGGPSSDVLLSVTVPFVPHGVCKDAYQGMYQITPQMMCAGDMENGKIDTCQGDSGGPLAWLDPKTDQVKLSGVVSQGAGCAQPYFPGVYADVANQLDWIKEVTGNCNEQTCQAGNCMRKQDLAPSTLEKFGRMTPHRVQAEPVKGYGTGEGDNHNARYGYWNCWHC